MANENKDIGEIVKKCKVLLLDIEGTTTSISFVKDKLFPYAEENVKQFLEAQWENDDVKGAVTALRKLAVEDQEKNLEGLVAIPGEDASKEDQIEGLVNNVKWQMSSDRKAGALKQLQGLIWQQGYDKGDIKGHVYDDVSNALEQWHSVEGQKVYIYSSGSVQAQKLLFGQSLAGDLLKYIDGHFDTAVGGKQEEASYAAIVEKIGCKADEILFVTDIVKEAEAAKTAGLHVALASREGNSTLPSEATDAYPVIHTFTQLAVSNKRKTEPQDEQPAKVPKTEIQKDVKTTSETDLTKVETPLPEKSEEPEKMEVEEAKEEEVIEQKEKTETLVKDVTKTKDVDENLVDMEPVVTEADENKQQKTEDMEAETATDKVDVKTDEKELEKENDKPVESTENTDSKPKTEETIDVPKENKDENVIETSAPVSESASPTVITEIEEITSDKENISEMAEIIEDLEPVVEEPVAEDVEELRNVGDVLEKECDEILSKVQGVTNLDTIPLRPLLNPIVEESMEAENTNDIMDSILDTEQEMEMQNNEDTATTTAKEKHPEKNTDEEEKATEKNGVPEETVTESDIKIEITPEQTNTENSQAEQNTETKEEKQESDKPKEEINVDKEDKVKEDKPVEEAQVNGKATNGEAVIENGDSNKDELSSRLTVENGKEVSSNGDAEKNREDNKIETEVSDIKVKTVSTEEPRTDLIEQATEA